MALENGRHVFDFDSPPSVPPNELKNLIGGKGANLVVMATELGLPVPPGFTITTEACRKYLGGAWPAGLDTELREHIGRLGERVGRRFGDPGNPLLVSVRSGAPVSMPGMMDTILNLGLTDATVEGLGRLVDDLEFAADCLRRFRDGYRAVIGTGDVPTDPWLQLRNAVEALFRSWTSERAVVFRRHEGISDELGTAVTVQAMVFGNRGPNSGTGVLFTRNPSTGEPALYGDFMFNAQGEDVVAGTHAPERVAALDERMPDVAAELRRYAELLERHHRDLCDIEFTIEDRRLWMLQVRVGKRSPRAALRLAIDMAEDESFPLSREEAVQRVAAQLADPPRVFVRAPGVPPSLTTGLPASPGVATGGIVTSPDAAETAADAGRPAILVRAETSPDDVRGMARSAGVLTARGGLASHAAVVARGWGIPAVVGAAGLVVGDRSVDVAGRTLVVGDTITIDGSTGEVFAGAVRGKWEVVPEAAKLLSWAAELGIELGASTPAAPAADGPDHERASPTTQARLTADDVTRALAVKGTVTIDRLCEALLASDDVVQHHVAALVAERLAEAPGGQIRLSAHGKLSAAELFASDRAAASLADARAVAVLAEFHAFDLRMKQIVTGWQIHEVATEQIPNDHADAAYDAALLDRLAALHAETVAWLEPLAASLRQFSVYCSRLARALELARAGDQSFVASPRVDSYHSIWFELHEHLIRLAGRKRADEAEAGRA